jgi:hypothetical protein
MQLKSKQIQKNRKGNPSSVARANRGSPRIPHPPPIGNYAITHSRRLRFTSNAAYVGNITYQNLLDCILYSTTATAPYDLFFMVRVRGIRMWALSALGTSTTITAMFDGVTAGSQGDRKLHTDASMGIEPAYLSVRPQPKTLAANFQISSGATAFFLDIPTGTVLDILLDYHSDIVGAPVAAQNLSVGATVGQLAFRGLDGVAFAGSKFTCPDAVAQI